MILRALLAASALFAYAQIVSTPAAPVSAELEARRQARALAPAVAFVEGWGQRGSLVRRLNNPGALRYGAEYARFATEAEGFAALERELTRRILKAWAQPYSCLQSRAVTCLDQVFERWSESATGAQYARKVMQAQRRRILWLK